MRDRPPRAEQVWTAAAVALVGWGATVAAAVVVDRHPDAPRSWWLAIGVAAVFGVVSSGSALRLLLRRLTYRRTVRLLTARLSESPGMYVPVRRAAIEELRWAVATGELAVAVALDRALMAHRPGGWDDDEDEEPEPPPPPRPPPPPPRWGSGEPDRSS
jgi:hypothetical protein